MKKIKVIKTNKAPLPVSAYSQAIIYDKLIFCSGQLGIDPRTNLLVKGIRRQTEQALLNIKHILNAGNSDLDKVLKVNIFIKNIKYFKIINEEYIKFFKKHLPARTTIVVKDLPLKALIEIDVIAICK